LLRRVKSAALCSWLVKAIAQRNSGSGGNPSSVDARRWCVHLKPYNVHLPEKYLAELERLVDEEYYPSIAEAIRIAIREFLQRELWGQWEDR